VVSNRLNLLFKAFVVVEFTDASEIAKRRG